MTPLTWLTLGLGVLLLPVADPVLTRARALAERGRLLTAPAQVLALRVPRPEVVALLAGVVATVGVGAFAGPVLGATAAIAVATLSRLVLVALRRRQARRRAAELLTALRLLAAELEAGGRPSAAFAAAAQACPEHAATFGAAADAARGGHDPPLESLALLGLAQAWSVALTTGAPLAAVVSRVADDLAARADQQRAVTAAVAGAQSSAALLAVLPVLGLLLGSAMQAHPLDVLFATRAGQWLCLVGVALDAGGVLWTLRLTFRAERA